MLPVYALYLAGGSSSGDESRPKWRLLTLRSLGLSAGFILLFTLMGAGAGWIGGALKYADQSWIRLVCGLLMLIFGLWMLFNIHWAGIRIFRRKNAKNRNSPRIGGFWNSFAFGLILALSWTPCMTPLLSAALVLAASAENATMLTGMAHLAFFALGLCIPMLLCLLLYGWLSGALAWIKKRQQWIRRAGGGLTAAYGLYLVLAASVNLASRGFFG